MANRAFQFDLNSGEWIECTDEKFINEDIEKIPCILVFNYEGYEDYIYCPTHHEIEEINSATDSEIISCKGCKFPKSAAFDDKKKFVFCPNHKQIEEIILTEGNEIITDTFCKFRGLIGVKGCNVSALPFRWRIFQSDDKSLVNIAADFSNVAHAEYSIVRNKEIYFISVSVTKKKYLFDWATSEQKFEIPKIVEDAAMETLRESTKAIYGLKPTVTTSLEGVKKILAYIERPFDPNITLLKFFFTEFEEFDKTFPYECKDNYKIICRLLEINPPKSLRKAYAKNSYAIIWYMIFKQFGAKDINFMQKFFPLDNFANFIPLDTFSFYRKNKIIITYSRNWQALEHFCKALIENRGEKFMINWLYKFSTKEKLNQNQIDTIKMFFDYEENISDELKTKLFKNGLTWYIHDAISAEVTDYLQERDNEKIFYDEKVLNCECVINDYEFKVVNETKNLYHVGLELANCVMTYKNRVLNLNSIIFVVSKENSLCACIEISDGEIIQALGYHNQILTGELEKVVQEWKNLKDITALKDATAEIFRNEGGRKISAQKNFETVEHHGGDMITQEEIDALLRGAY